MYTILHAIVGYFFLLFVVRMLSRRPGGQLTPFEFVIVFLIGGLIIASTVGDDRSITNCVGAILTIGLMHRITARVRARSSRIGRAIDGIPLVLLAQGQWQTEAMHGTRLDDADVMAAGRSKGVRTLEEIKYAIVERVGTISIIAAEKEKEDKEAEREQVSAPRKGGDRDAA